jgi:predicted O-methyltransferase YrrM
MRCFAHCWIEFPYVECYSSYAPYFLAVSPEYGRFLYVIARACKATRIVEFGTSMGVSTIYLAAALRDDGGGQLIGSELEPSKAAPRAHIEAAGLLDLVDLREGDALDTLQNVGGEVDLALIDGAWSLYLPVLKLIESRLRAGVVIMAENAFAGRLPCSKRLLRPDAVDRQRTWQRIRGEDLVSTIMWKAAPWIVPPFGNSFRLCLQLGRGPRPDLSDDVG